LGAFVLMAVCGFTINIMTLLALSLAVGLLVDDAIVVRENIFRYIELGETCGLRNPISGRFWCHKKTTTVFFIRNIFDISRAG